MTLILFFVLAALGCQPKNSPPESKDLIERARLQIGRGQYQHAIDSLNERLLSNPADDEARVTLASAYVHRAGVRIQDYFVLETMFREKTRENFQAIDLAFLNKVKFKSNTALARIFDFLKLLNQIVRSSTEISEKFNAIPDLSEPGAQDVKIALDQLELLQKPKDGMVLFRGAVKLMNFKHNWTTGKFIEFGDSRLCRSLLQDLVRGLGRLRVSTVSMIEDVAVGFPKSQPEFKSNALKINRDILSAEQKLLSLLKEADTVEDVIKSNLNEKDIEVFQCDF